MTTETSPATTTERTTMTTPLPDHSVIPPVWSRITNLDVDRGEGSWLITRDGERYLDYSSGIGVTNTGHAHPRVAAAIAAQAQKLLHGQQNILYHEPGLRLYDRLPDLLPGGPYQAFLSNSGAEAIEASVKLARVATGRPAIIAFLERKWQRERDYRLIKELWTYGTSRISVRFVYEWHDEQDSWFRAHGNEQWEFDASGLMRRREASINDVPIRAADRRFLWPQGPRPHDAPGLTELGL